MGHKSTGEGVTIGKRIRQIRELRGWSQHDLTMRTGIHCTGISSHEKGRFEPKLKQLHLYAAAFGMTLAQFLDGVRPSADLRRPTTGEAA